jgi:hypothetical protein
MAKLVGELLLEMVGAFIRGWAYSLMLKVGTWLDTKIPGRKTKIAVGMLLGVAAYFLIPIVSGLLSF